jgi:hypothetical protein
MSFLLYRARPHSGVMDAFIAAAEHGTFAD